VTDEATAVAVLTEGGYDLVLLDVALAGGDGFDLLGRIAGDRHHQPAPVIVLTGGGRPVDVVKALDLGADDVVVEPFAIEELEARIRTVLRRTASMRDLSPLTGLPGNRAITAELARRIATGQPLAVAHVDIDDFITFCARCLRHAADGAPDSFIGHIGGDDFIVAMAPGQVEPFFAVVFDLWKRGIDGMYDAADVRRGGITVTDRRGEPRLHPIAALSVGVATNSRRRLTSQWEASAIAAEMKEHAKRRPGCDLQVDRRGA
jgi:CheY-like chemotaxis protein